MPGEEQQTEALATCRREGTSRAAIPEPSGTQRSGGRAAWKIYRQKGMQPQPQRHSAKGGE
jgi:hypothetical protein